MFIADLHIHSKYSRATSRECIPETLDFWARRKGIGLLGTGDFTHPAWRRELGEKLERAEEGLYRLKEGLVLPGGPAGVGEGTRFVVSGEISSIYKRGGRVRKVHNVILLPGLEAAEALSRRLEEIGNLHSDGRPILGLDSRDLLEITLEICPEAVFIPAHIWTPHFSLFGAYSGFDAIEECFGDLTGHIHALETGLSSDPPMNWRLSALDRFAMVSNSDAHSPGNLAREANLFNTERTYPHLARALAEPNSGAFAGTIEFYPEEGKYHFDGHRGCKVCQSPGETVAGGGRCPVCGGRITVGVLHRVEELADREEGFVPPNARKFESLIPLPEVIAACTGFSTKSKKNAALYARLLAELGPELGILRQTPVEAVAGVAGPAVAEGLRHLRRGQVEVHPGYDGEYGKVKILSPEEIEELSGQMRFFLGDAAKPAPRPERKRAAGKPPARPAPPVETPRTDLLQGLNPEQREAVLSPQPTVLVEAGPGTGKTGVLTARVVHLVEGRGVPAAKITAVTFTNRAAGEMRTRLERHFGGKRPVRAMGIGTFHSVCLELLRQSGREAVLLDESAARLVMEEILRERGDRISPGEAVRAVSLAKSGVAPAPDLPNGLYAAYNARLEEWGVLDFDDVLLHALELSERGKHKTAPFTHLLVDEFQDINPVQYRLLRAWARGGESLFVIGDPNQSIYGFRGSDPRCFRQLRDDRPDAAVVELARNYRSARPILEAAASVLPGSAPTLAAERGEGAKVRVMAADTPFSEALFVAKEINRLVGGMDMLDSHGRSLEGQLQGFSDIAVLYRTNRQAAVLEDCLAKEGIPYVVAGRDKLLRRPETGQALAFFRLLLCPEDRFSLAVCLRAFAGCTSRQAAEIEAAHRTGGGDLTALARALEGAPAGSALTAARIEQYGRLVKRGKPHKVLAAWLEEFAPGADWGDGLLHMAVFHDTIEDFLRAAALGREGDLRRYGGGRYRPDAVTLSTLHGAKGLEFPVVFLCGASADRLPLRGRGGHTDPEEERRLLYVGMTRAMDELTLISPGEESPFLANLSPEWTMRADIRRRPEPVDRQVSLFD